VLKDSFAVEQSDQLLSAVEGLAMGVGSAFGWCRFVLEQKVKISVSWEAQHHHRKLLWAEFSPECTSAHSLCLKGFRKAA